MRYIELGGFICMVLGGFSMYCSEVHRAWRFYLYGAVVRYIELGGFICKVL